MAKLRYIQLLSIAAALVSAHGCAGLCQSPWGPQPQTNAGLTQSRAVGQQPENVTVRGQSPGDMSPGGYPRTSQPVSGGPVQPTYGNSYGYFPSDPAPPTAQNQTAPYPSPQYQSAQYQPPPYQPTLPQTYAGVPQQPNYAYPPLPNSNLPAPPAEAMPGISGSISPITPGYPSFQPPTNLPPEIPATPTPLDVYVEETRTGQFMFGVTVNSNAGLIGNIVVSERNFDILNPPTSWDDFATGRAFRGGGQGFRLEAQPGTVLQRYLVSLTEPYFLGTDNSFDVSGYYYNRIYFDWTEARVGGRLALGRRLTPDLSVAASLRMEDVDIYNPRVNNVAALNAALGHSDIFGGKVTVSHDTRDIPFAPTQGHLITASFEQVFGEFSFPRGDFEWAQYFTVRQRPDGTGRHTAGFVTKAGMSGSGTPIFENYFAGGFSTIRGFQFRGASPKDNGVTVGGRFQWLNSAEYYFPLTADDMIRGTVFCDFGTVETNVALHPDQFRVAPGFGFRINVPAMGPAPLAFDFAFPVAQADTDHKQVFSFFFGASR